jgi:uncharacterized cupin superfamily protein
METGPPALVPDPLPPRDLAPEPDTEQQRCCAILPAPATGWSQLAMGIWELRASSWGDCHPYDEVNHVLAGTLVVECDGQTMSGGPGDTIRVPAGLPARYSAPEYARMLYVYGPNPEGRPSTTFD